LKNIGKSAIDKKFPAQKVLLPSRSLKVWMELFALSSLSIL